MWHSQLTPVPSGSSESSINSLDLIFRLGGIFKRSGFWDPEMWFALCGTSSSMSARARVKINGRGEWARRAIRVYVHPIRYGTVRLGWNTLVYAPLLAVSVETFSTWQLTTQNDRSRQALCSRHYCTITAASSACAVGAEQQQQPRAQWPEEWSSRDWVSLRSGLV